MKVLYRELCATCDGDGTLGRWTDAGGNVRRGVKVCPRCDGDCWEPEPIPVAQPPDPLVTRATEGT
jgi:hypothetical protein